MTVAFGRGAEAAPRLAPGTGRPPPPSRFGVGERRRDERGRGGRAPRTMPRHRSGRRRGLRRGGSREHRRAMGDRARTACRPFPRACEHRPCAEFEALVDHRLGLGGRIAHYSLDRLRDGPVPLVDHDDIVAARQPQRSVGRCSRERVRKRRPLDDSTSVEPRLRVVAVHGMAGWVSEVEVHEGDLDDVEIFALRRPAQRIREAGRHPFVGVEGEDPLASRGARDHVAHEFHHGNLGVGDDRGAPLAGEIGRVVGRSRGRAGSPRRPR